MSVNLTKLDSELRDAGVPIIGVHGTGNCTNFEPFICDGATIEFEPVATGPQITQGNNILAAHTSDTPNTAYAKAFLAQRRIIVNAFVTFHEAFRTAGASPTLVQYQAVLGNTLTILLTLPASFTIELAHEQAGLQLPNGPSSGWTLVQCQQWHTLLSGWLGRALAGAAIALAGQLDG